MDKITTVNNNEYFIKGVITALLNELSILNPSDPTPKHIHITDNIKAPDENDAMLGSLLVESFITGAFNIAANDNIAANNTSGSSVLSYGVDDAMEVWSAFLKNQKEESFNDTQKHGKGTHGLIGSKRAARDTFNLAPKNAEPEAATWKQLQIERALTYYSDQLNYVFAQEQDLAPALAA